MKEKIYTIPVNEALEQNGECLFCTLNNKLEEEILNYILGASYMEEDIREETDKMGFCEYHYRQMYDAQNRLGVALMLDTHLKKINRDLKDLLDDELKAAEDGKKKSLFKKEEHTSKLIDYLDNIENSCYACNRMQGRMNSYIDTFFYLWKTSEEFRGKVVGSKGFCLKHFSMLVKEGKKRYNKNEYLAMLKALFPRMEENLKRVSDDIDWFVKKFDYRYENEPWKNSKDALPRAITKVSGIDVEFKAELR